MFETLKPYGSRIFVKLVPLSEKSAGGIFLSQSEQPNVQIGEVTAVGDVKDIAVGMRIYFSKYAGSEMSDTHVMLKEEEILAYTV